MIMFILVFQYNKNPIACIPTIYNRRDMAD